VNIKDSLFGDLKLIMRKLSIDKESDVKCLLNQGETYTEIACGCDVVKTTLSRIRTHYDPNRPCNDLSVQRS
jgi:DNA invertase Pin-like site-specific DNA recombinase